MVNYKGKDTFLNDVKKGEIIFANHKLEFLRFFDSHKKLCDEISGLKHHIINSLGEDKKVIITRSNFELGIKKLNSFLIDYMHYIDEKPKRDEIFGRFERLEDEFIDDFKYDSFVKKEGNLNTSQEIEFNKRYIYYLIKSFDISYLMSKYLQKSLNIASREVEKNIQFANYDGFFNNLSVYRGEIANDLSNLSYGSFFENFKKLMGYVYTYKYLIMSREQKHIDDLLKLIYSYITRDENIKLMIKFNDKVVIKSDERKKARKEFKVLRNAFNGIYNLCNRSLSMKNILPKSKTDVLVDNTLI